VTEPKQALSSSGVSVIGQDCGEIIRRTAKRMLDREEKAKQRQRELDSKYAYDEDARDKIVCMIHRCGVHPRTGIALFTASTVTELPRVGLVRTTPDEERFLESSMRLELAKAFLAGGVCKDYDEARLRAAKARLYMEKAFARDGGNAEVA
jgi:hypothetical protein